ncbi:hypothetical protein M2137_001385 [Parabacteroides sp. PFB2-10]|uniref:NVEALA domain-containing protein n=1 Tax=Parabacteroides sp. PFB2-10 TaxID=1742405 RepID=UPI00247468BE|nr:NVEALA domain-containing protein [Parabacteroides sp. PFB2-10]MDH6312610.1 hypothetical protein [Parabacteroides sp. PFB2-10]
MKLINNLMIQIMKKRILSIVMVAVIAVTAGWNVYRSESKVALSDLGLANVEALASCEKLLGTCWMNYSTWECCDAGNYACAPCD